MVKLEKESGLRQHSRPHPAWSALASAVLSLTGIQVSAQQATTDEPLLETVTVISTGLRGQQRTLADSPAPIDIINSEQLLKTGRAELSEAISKVLPSFNFGTNIAGFNSVNRPLSNRGLAPVYTLVLVNGKRRHNGTAAARGSTDNSGANSVDIDMIPVSAVSHIEVLKDSAAAQYGSDAVAGVVNIILKAESSGGHLESSYGKLFSGQGETTKFAGNQGFELADGGFFHVSADARKRGTAAWNDKADHSIRAYDDDAQEAAWNRVAIKNGDPDITAFNLAYNAELPFNGNSSTLYSHATYGERDAEAYNWYRYPNGTASVPEVFPDGYYPINNIKDTDYQVLLGDKGLFIDWNWDLSTSYGRNTTEHSSDLNINPSLGTDSPTQFDELATFRFEQWVNNLDVTRHTANLFTLNIPTQLSLGLEHRWERYRTFAGEESAYITGSYNAASGAQAAVTIRPENEVSLIRNNVAGYIDLALTPHERWYVGLAARAEHYDDDSGNTFSFKLNSRYELTDKLALRGTLGSGFRAPSLTQIAYNVYDNRVNTDINGNIVPAVTYLTPSDSALAKTLGGDELEPEKSQNIGLGLAWKPAPRTNVTLDAYLIDIGDRITLTSNLYDRGNGAIDAILAEYGQAAGTYVNFYTNAFDTRTRGLDLVADHTTVFNAWGNVRWSLALNYNKTTIEDVVETPQILADNGIQLVGRDREGDLTVASPRTKWIFGAHWALNKLAVNLQTTRYGSVKTLAVNSSGDRSFGAKWITDLDIAYTVFEPLTLSIGGTNIFDVRPDKNGIYYANGLNRYGQPPFSPAGGFWYGKIAYDF
jgi:iron complex outermembrane receptor protein